MTAREPRGRSRARTPDAATVEARRAKVARLLAQGCTRREMLPLLGMSTTANTLKTIDRDIAAVRAAQREQLEQDRQREQDLLAEHMERLEADLDAARCARDACEPGSTQWAEADKRALEREQALLKARMDLGILLRAPQRAVVYDGDDLAALSGDALLERFTEASAKSARMRRLVGMAASKGG